MPKIYLDKDEITIDDLVAVARDRAPVSISPVGEGRVEKTSRLIARWVKEKKVIYGITTGFGALCDVSISETETRKLQENVLMSHAAGVGDPLPEEVVRAIMALRVHDLSLGYSGCRMETLRYLITFLNAGLTPVIPEKGSVGASGDLAPTAHLGLVLIGRGEAVFKGCRMPGAAALSAINLPPLKLAAGEGLALINGTQVMTGMGALVVHDAVRISKMADIACAMTLEVLMGSSSEFDPRIHQVRPHPGQILTADNMLRLTADSEIMASHKGCARLQDAYTLRCSPQIHGASKDALAHARRVIDIEINATTTNPLIFADTEEIRLGGNFHGQPVAMAADYLSMGLAELGSVSERRIERLVNPQLSDLPAFLTEHGGLNSGYMIGQYVAAALVSENKVLAHPACIDSIPTSANKEDHVSMGSIAMRQTREILDNVEHVVAIELLCAAQAYDLLQKKQPMTGGRGTHAAYRVIRRYVPYMAEDRDLYIDIQTMRDVLRRGEVVRAVEAAVGEIRSYARRVPPSQ
ncbi:MULTISPECIES: histidine ammonia-lyase [Desulfococcus]|uniref:Histidine ammonia-lyase n=1 Tax=Desulfococcus multivorans DSM 2059 TaxID=1121405 RepID=S7ULR6_DESML|nr:histidine ammonia-lyase [Desulfococcus multivorans]AOY58185.1 HutH: histidine ammonia-lyase [Desulfococcus multivorans]AQV00536.1 histidine ammonia-lyase [Desulfococcus multivorans]EPR34824.1 Histidine ammonia-lyase [Desulfococcus multivorans DSM 2059]SJZ96107.1 histidine ammonia-lyase [Desulfococcus multivorans DSM 2059]